MLPRAWFDCLSVVLAYGFQRYTHDHSIFFQHSLASTVVLIVYVDDIILSSSDSAGITNLKRYLSQHLLKTWVMFDIFLGLRRLVRSATGLLPLMEMC